MEPVMMAFNSLKNKVPKLDSSLHTLDTRSRHCDKGGIYGQFVCTVRMQLKKGVPAGCALWVFSGANHFRRLCQCLPA